MFGGNLNSSTKDEKPIQDSNHTIELLQTAIPYLNKEKKRTMNIVLKAAEFQSSFYNIENQDELSACDLDETELDMEAMLLDMKRVCSNKENEVLDTIINFLNAQKLYHTYKTAASFNSNSSTDSMNNYAKILGLGGLNDDMFSDNPMDLIKNFLPPDQKASFDNISMLLSAMS